MGDHLPGTTELVEVVDVRRAQVGLQRVEQFGQLDALGLGLDAVYFGIQLRHVGLVAGDRERHARRLRDRTLHRAHRRLQCAIAEIAAVLDEHLVPVAVAQAEDRRRHHGERKALLQPGDLGVDLGIDLRGGAALALTERLERNERDTGVGRVGELQRVQTRELDRVRHAIGIARDLGDLGQHGVGTCDRGAFRQLHAGNQVQLVLGRNEAGRHRLEHQAGGQQQAGVDHEHQATTAQQAANRTVVLLRTGLEEAVERTEDPSEQTVDQAGEAILRRAVRLEQACGQGRRQGQRVDRRDHGRNRDGDGELLVERTGHTGQERHRHEHGTQHQRDRHDRAGHFTHCLVGGGQRSQAFFDVAFDVLHHHDRVIDHDADRQHQPEQGQGVDREAEYVQRREGTHDRHRHGDQRNDRGTPGLQEQDHHQHHQGDRLEQRGDHGLDRIAHEDGGVIHRFVLHARRELLGQLIHGVDDRVADFQRVRAGGLEDTDTDRVLAVQLRAQRVVTGAQLQAGDIGQAHHFTVVTGLEHDIAEFLFAAQATLGVDQGQEVAARHRLGAELAGRDLHVLLAHRTHHVAGGQAARGDLVRVQPRTHGVVTAAEHLRITDALQACQGILDVQAGVVAQVQRVVLAVRRGQMDHHQEGRRLLLGGDTLAAHVLGQARLRLGDAVLHLDRGFVRIGTRAEGHRHLQHAVRAGDGLDVHHVLDAVDRFFQWRGHRFSDHFGVGARVHRAHHHRGRHHFGVLADRQHRDRDQASGEDHDRQHRREDRPVNEKTGKVHGWIPGVSPAPACTTPAAVAGDSGGGFPCTGRWQSR